MVHFLGPNQLTIPSGSLPGPWRLLPSPLARKCFEGGFSGWWFEECLVIHDGFMNDAGNLIKRISWPMIFSPKTAVEFILVVIIKLSQLRP